MSKKECRCCEFHHGISSMVPHYSEEKWTCGLCHHELSKVERVRWDKLRQEAIEKKLTSPTKPENTRNLGKSSEVPGILGNEWEDEFDKNWDSGAFDTSSCGNSFNPARLKSFISSLLSQQKAEMNVKIGMLRQWLNEDRITDPNKMVTNEQIEMWLEEIK